MESVFGKKSGSESRVMNEGTMCLDEALEYGISKLSEAKISEAELDAWYLLSYVTKLDRGTYFAEKERRLTGKQEQYYMELVQKRANRIPLQHLTGEQEFMGLTFQVNEHVLVPRQDTEILVEEALKAVKPGMHILDMCTGSGCILLSLIWHGNKKNGLCCGTTAEELWKRFAVTGVGVDVSKDALKVAEENRTMILGTEASAAVFLESDLFARVEGAFDMIVSNPPYIRTAVIETLEEEVRCHDPLLALDGKEDGLYFYEKIIKESPAFLKKGGRILFEIGHDQAEAVCELMKQRGFEQIKMKKDLAGLDRVLSGVYNG